jgi:hypothetical protein
MRVTACHVAENRASLPRLYKPSPAVYIAGQRAARPQTKDLRKCEE